MKTLTPLESYLLALLARLAKLRSIASRRAAFETMQEIVGPVKARQIQFEVGDVLGIRAADLAMDQHRQAFDEWATSEDGVKWRRSYEGEKAQHYTARKHATARQVARNLGVSQAAFRRLLAEHENGAAAPKAGDRAAGAFPDSIKQATMATRARRARR